MHGHGYRPYTANSTIKLWYKQVNWHQKDHFSSPKKGQNITDARVISWNHLCSPKKDETSLCDKYHFQCKNHFKLRHIYAGHNPLRCFVKQYYLKLLKRCGRFTPWRSSKGEALPKCPEATTLRLKLIHLRLAPKVMGAYNERQKDF